MRAIAKMKPQAKLKPQAKVAPSPQGWVAAADSGQTRRPPAKSRADLEAQIAPLTPASAGAGQPVRRQDGSSPAPVPPGKSPPLKQVLESYFSDMNLKQDRHLRDMISSSPGGWLDIEAVLQLKRVRALKAKREDTLRAVRDSKLLEVWRDPGDGSAAVRRIQGRPLPAFEAAPAPRSRPPPSDLEYDEDAVPPDEVAAPPPMEVDDDDEEPAAKRRKGPAEARPGSRYVGRIKSFQKVLGMGFIACTPTMEVFGKDIAIDRGEMSGFSVGDYVAFELAVDPEFGTPKGVQLEAADASQANMLLFAKTAPKPNKASSLVARASARAPAAKAPGALAVMRFTGKVLSYNDKAKSGKIECPETFAALGAHITVVADELAGFEVGDRVSFTLRAARAVELEAE